MDGLTQVDADTSTLLVVSGSHIGVLCGSDPTSENLVLPQVCPMMQADV
jgi:hypothetical protein